MNPIFQILIFTYYLFALALIYLSWRSFRGGIEYLEYFKTELARPQSNFAPFLSLIIPCRGMDQGLAENIAAALTQSYSEYEVIFVVDDENDPAVEIIRAVIAKKTAAAKVIIAPKATHSAQKIENLREAVLHINTRSEILCFADSDARPHRHWLRHLVAPLEAPEIGCATGYRWFISEKPSLPAELRSAWNASIASYLGKNTQSNFCWGGATAIRRDTFEKLAIREKWRGTLSDDFTVTRAMRSAGLPIYFVPQCLTASVENCSLTELFEFTTRQMKITRVYAPNLWIATIIGTFLFNFVMISGLLLLIFGVAVWLSLATIILVSFFSIGKSRLRLKAVMLALPQHEKQLQKQMLPQCLLWPFTPAIFFYNAIAALFSRRINWRGSVYELKSPTETVIIDGK